jgi:hypothetical protein
MCAAIWLFGLFVQICLLATEKVYHPSDSTITLMDNLTLAERTDMYSVKFFPFAAVGGMLWALGNCLSVPIINSIGLSMGLLIWGAANMLMGWATGELHRHRSPQLRSDLPVECGRV